MKLVIVHVAEEAARRLATDSTDMHTCTVYPPLRAVCPRPDRATPYNRTTGQQLKVMTSHKPVGQRWVTREQYVRYFVLAGSLLDPTGPGPDALRATLLVRSVPGAACRRAACRHARLSRCARARAFTLGFRACVQRGWVLLVARTARTVPPMLRLKCPGAGAASGHRPARLRFVFARRVCKCWPPAAKHVCVPEAMGAPVVLRVPGGVGARPAGHACPHWPPVFQRSV